MKDSSVVETISKLNSKIDWMGFVAVLIVLIDCRTIKTISEWNFGTVLAYYIYFRIIDSTYN